MKKNFVKIIASIIPAALVLGMALSGCGANQAGAAVQSVAYIAGVGNVGAQERFAGIVCAKNEESVKSDKQKKILEVLVKEGDQVQAGQSLCTYDISLAQLNLEKARLELTQLENSLADKKAQKESLEKERAEANADRQLEYTLEIQRCDTEIRECEYNINLKKKDVETLEKSAEVGECTAPVAGRIKSIKGADNNDPYGESSSEITFVITEAGDYRVMGYVNENNATQISEGLSVSIRSRVNNDTWAGEVVLIDWENPADGQNQNDFYYSGSSDTMTQTSKYPFYVQLDNSQGLLLGQHVYIEPASGQVEEASLNIPGLFFISVEGENGKIWAENSQGKLEKRNVKVEAIGEGDIYKVVSGLTAKDYIAFPSDDLKAGMKCEEYEGELPMEGADETFEMGPEVLR